MKDYYNFAVQNVIEQLYRATKGKALTDFPVREGKWNIYIKNPEQLSEHAETVKELIPDTVLSFKGLKKLKYSADGLGDPHGAFHRGIGKGKKISLGGLCLILRLRQ
mgnify:CR=1 FL=1